MRDSGRAVRTSLRVSIIALVIAAGSLCLQALGIFYSPLQLTVSIIDLQLSTSQGSAPSFLCDLALQNTGRQSILLLGVSLDAYAEDSRVLLTEDFTASAGAPTGPLELEAGRKISRQFSFPRRTVAQLASEGVLPDQPVEVSVFVHLLGESGERRTLWLDGGKARLQRGEIIVTGVNCSPATLRMSHASRAEFWRRLSRYLAASPNSWWRDV